MTQLFDTYCGLSCKDCEYKEKSGCSGCVATKGKPFFRRCEVADCANKNGRRFCGECPDFPCDLLKKYSFDSEHGDNGKRIENCKAIKTQLVNEARAGINPIGYCGFHCDMCFMGKWCGGCRSDYNCCSFATLFDDGMCPNAKCVNEKQINACWECDELDTCKKGYYGNENEYLAKAAAIFIRNHDESAYAKALKKATDNEIDGQNTFNKSGSVENVVAILEQYI